MSFWVLNTASSEVTSTAEITEKTNKKAQNQTTKKTQIHNEALTEYFPFCAVLATGSSCAVCSVTNLK